MKDGWTDRQIDRRNADIKTDRRMDKWTQTYRWIDRRTKRQTDR